MSKQAIPLAQWDEFLQSFSRKHQGWLVTIQTHDVQTGETTATRFMPLKAIRLDLEDEKNPRINVTVLADQKELTHILFRPSDLTLELSAEGNEQAVRIVSIHTVTTVRFRVAVAPELIDGVA
jgi:hypothetical protein